MVTLTGLLRTFVTVRNPLSGLPYEGKKRIKFNNGVELDLTFPQFRDIRDCYSSLKKYKVKQLGENSFEADFKSFEIIGDVGTICLVSNLLKHFRINIVGEDKFQIEGKDLKIEGTMGMLAIFKELFLDGEYKGDYAGKVVLDVGGFQGESAVYFWSAGAKKVVVYEPIKEFYSQIRTNMKLNNIPSEVHQAGIGALDTKVKIGVFGDDKSKQEVVEVKNISDVIVQSGADVAKIDCEGAEICLTSVSNENLRKISQYELELHGLDVQENVTKKFLEAGFKVTRFKKIDEDVSLASFKRKDNP
jgi:FkbM family methyltransferase